MKYRRKCIAAASLFVLLASFVVIRWRASDPDKVIRSSGTYPSPDGTHLLSVRVQDGLVYYDVDGQTSDSLANGFSIYHRWFFYWDKSGNLWAHSSDVGSNVWENGERDFSPRSMMHPDNPPMPDAVRKNLPQSMLRQ